MTLLKKLTIGTAMAAMAMAGTTAQAQMQMTPPPPGGPMMPPPDGNMMPPADGTMMNSTMTTPTMVPTLVSGTVQNYYVDRAGYVSAMDVQTADGVKMVRFAPSMAQRVTALYPVGSSASVYVTSRMMGTMTSYDLAGVGPEMPTPTSMMMPSEVDSVDLLKSTPYIQMGAKEKGYSGKITGYISDPMSGEVLGIVLDKDTLVRIPMENRLIQASTSPTGITPLFAGANVAVRGYDESPLYGVVSPFAKRVVASSISVNGQPLGPLGFGRIRSRRNPLFGFNINFLGGSAPEELGHNSGSMGYMPYNMNANMMDNAAVTNGDTMMNSTGTMMNNGM